MLGTRSLYDEGVTAADTQMSVGVLGHLLDPVRVKRCDDCRPAEPGMIGAVGVSFPAGRTLSDVAVEMRGLGVVKSSDPKKLYRPKCTKCIDGSCDKCQPKMVHLPDCGSHREWSRLSDPACNLRGTGFNRAGYLMADPQEECRWMHPGEINGSSRLSAKDAHIPCIPVPDTGSWISGEDSGIPKCPAVGDACGTYIMPEDYNSFR